MKKIYILRHGSAEEKSENKKDFERKLTDKGEAEIRYAAKSVIKTAEFPDLIISSPAKRAQKTALVFSKGIGYPGEKIETSPALYESSLEAVMDILKKQNHEISSVCLVGHNPLLDEIVKFLVPDFPGSLSKGSITCIELKNGSVEKGSGAVLFYDFSGSESSAKKQITESIQHEIYEELIGYFQSRNEEIMKPLRESLSGVSSSLSKKYSKLVEKKSGKIKKSRQWAKDKT